MSRSCTICPHTDRAAIDAAVVEGQSFRAISRQHGVSKDAVARHRAHIAPAIIAIQQTREAAGAETLLDRVEALIRRAESFLAAAEVTGQVAQGLAAIREIRALLELLGKASGELKPEGGVNVNVGVNLLATPEVAELCSVLMLALQPFPDARIAAAKALDVLEVGS